MIDVVNVDNVIIEDLIFEIRGKQVMIDSDLARLYECKNGTKTINLAVKRHFDRFPEDFCFQLTKEEYYNILRFQSETLELEQGKYSKYLPYVFTEQGVAMLATILRTSVASKMSVSIMRAFVTLRKFISTNLLEQKYINNQVMKNTEDIKLLQESFQKFEEKSMINEIYFDGQIYDAYSKIQDHNLKVCFSNKFHDRYFILDNSKVYHCGSSINRIGYKTFSINLINDNGVCNLLIDRVNYIINK